jgi:hypothetical protein
VDDIDPARTVDRLAEREEFTSMLRFTEDGRLLIITDREKTGKSTLLRRLKYDCKWTHNVPVSLVDLKANPDNELGTVFSPIDLVDWLYQDLVPTIAFPTFDFINTFRLQYLLPPIARSVASVQDYLTQQVAPSGTNIEGGAHAQSVNGGVQAGIYIRDLHLEPQKNWASPKQEIVAVQKCVEGFLADLRRHAHESSLAILIDSYERRQPNLHSWLLDDFVRPLTLGPDRPRRLLVVLAGDEGALPPFEPAYQKLIRSRPLERWTSEHVRAFLTVHGYGGLQERWLKNVCESVQNGMSIGGALELAYVYARYAPAAP